MTSPLTLIQRAQIVPLKQEKPEITLNEICEKVHCTVKQARYWFIQKDIADHKHTGCPSKKTPELVSRWNK
jgi:hypothetical protein